MKEVRLYLVSFMLTLPVLLISLFDPSEKGLGINYVGVENIPSWILSVAEFFGNILWIPMTALGIVVIFLIGALISKTSHSNMQQQVTAALKNGLKLEDLYQTWWQKIWSAIIFGMAFTVWYSGFFYSGAIWMLATFTASAIRSKIEVAARIYSRKDS